MNNLATICIVILPLALISCEAAETTNSSGEKATSDQAETHANSGAIVKLNGITEELEVQPVMCGLNRKGDGFTIMAGPNDGDSNPRNNEATLTIGGKKTEMRYGSMTSIRYQPTAPGAAEENAISKGPEQAWVTDGQFQWSGQTQSGNTLEVTIACP